MTMGLFERAPYVQRTCWTRRPKAKKVKKEEPSQKGLKDTDLCRLWVLVDGFWVEIYVGCYKPMRQKFYSKSQSLKKGETLKMTDRHGHIILKTEDSPHA